MTDERLNDELRGRLAQQLTAWSQELLPTDGRQRALYFKHTLANSLEITAPSLAAIMAGVNGPGMGFVAVGEMDEDELELPADGENAGEQRVREIDPGSRELVVSNKSALKLASALTTLERKSQQVYADRGFWSLYLGVGMLCWGDELEAHSPLLLVPVRLRRQANNEPPMLTRTEDDVVVNPVLRSKLEIDYGISLPDIDEEAVDVERILRDVASVVDRRPGWAVERRCVMTIFSFQKEAMYRDLVDNADRIVDSALVQMVALGPDTPGGSRFAFTPVSDEKLDNYFPPEELMSILDADGSQRKCILAARDGRSFVMDGPPGTGKSQTIANIIVELIATGRSVLFVSEKAAALDVVRNRLADAQLGEYLLELHSHLANKKAVVGELDAALIRYEGRTRPAPVSERRSLVSARQELSAFASAMNDRRSPLGMSMFHAIGRLTELREFGPYQADRGTHFGDIDADGFAALIGRAEQLARHWRPAVERERFLWREVLPDRDGFAEVQRLSGSAWRVAQATRDLSERIGSVDDDLHVKLARTAGGARARVALLELLDKRLAPLLAWFTTGDRGGLSIRLRFLSALTERHATARDALESQFGSEWTAIDSDRAGEMRGLEQLSDFGRPIADDTTTWCLVAIARFLSGDDRLVPMRDAAVRLAGLFRLDPAMLTPQRTFELAQLAALGASPALPESDWLSGNVQRALDESCQVLAGLVDAVRERETEIRGVFTPAALELDLEALKMRFDTVHTGLRRFASAARADRKALKSVTVGGRADKVVIACLPAAVSWKEAASALTSKEPSHAPKLGSYYQGLETDFARVKAAIDVAHQVTSLAGQEIEAVPLAAQLSLNGSPDPHLSSIGDNFIAQYTAWHSDLTAHLGSFAASLASRPFAEVARWCVGYHKAIAPAADLMAAMSRLAGVDLTVKQAVSAIDQAGQATEASTTIYESFDSDQALLGPIYNGLETDWPRMFADLEWVEQVASVLREPITEATAQALLTPSFTASDLVPRLEAWTIAVEDLVEDFEPARSRDLREELADDLDRALQLATRMAQSAADDIGEWTVHHAARTALNNAGLSSALNILLATPAPPDAVAPALEHALLESWVDQNIAADPRLANYRAKDRDALVAKFRREDKALITGAHRAISAACDSRQPEEASERPAALIRREAQKRSRHKSIRTLLTETRGLTQVLKPCFMMSPLSVSQYLPPDFTFDVVIFDEASQVLPSDAINCLYRGRQVIVAGDQKQLPPTNFFTAVAPAAGDGAANSDDGGAGGGAEDYESLLDLAKAAGVIPALPLTWHYRSQHESLITYSNYRFYDGSLQTFPGASFEAADLGVEHFYVSDGVYRRGSSRDNPVEAAKVVDRILEHRRLHPSRSLGVVTFSGAQEDAVLAAMEARSQSEPLLAELLGEQDRLTGFFVKNLENVQGDERDIIIFSIGYGPDEAGKFTSNFGPVNRPGGWRRLNVAITRARRRVEVVSSFRAANMADSDNTSVQHLRGYLDFAERGISALALNLTGSLGDAESPFEEDVIRVIRGWGYEAVPQVGSAGYRIDIGVRHPMLPGAYLLAVECDGAAYHSAKPARDRDRLREGVLRGLGWNVHQIWGISWYRERAAQMERLRDAIEQALSKQSTHLSRAFDGDSTAEPYRSASTLPDKVAGQEKPTFVGASDDLSARTRQPTSGNGGRLDEATAAPTRPGIPSWARPYRPTRPRLNVKGALDSPDARPALRGFFFHVLSAEAPIHEELTYQRLTEVAGISDLTRSERRNAHSAIMAVVVESKPVTQDERLIFRLQDTRASTVRIPDGGIGFRAIDHVPSDEIENAILAHLEESSVVASAEFGGLIASLFGWSGDTAVGDVVDAALHRLVERNVVRRVGGGMYSAGRASRGR